jgi:hypothetical protein
MLYLDNHGDVTLHVDFSETELFQNDVKITIPDPFVIPPKRNHKCQVGFCAAAAGPFTCKIKFSTKEEYFELAVSGIKC